MSFFIRLGLAISIIVGLVKTQSIFNFNLNCGETSFEEWSSFTCMQCGVNQIKDPNQNACICNAESIPPAGYKNLITSIYDCESCASDTIQNPSTLACTQRAPSGNCTIPTSIYQIFDTSGVALDPPQCFECATDTYPRYVDGYGDFCVPCSLDSTAEQCVCANRFGGECFNSDEITKAKAIVTILEAGDIMMTFQDLTSTSIDSKSFQVNSALLKCNLNKV